MKAWRRRQGKSDPAAFRPLDFSAPAVYLVKRVHVDRSAMEMSAIGGPLETVPGYSFTFQARAVHATEDTTLTLFFASSGMRNFYSTVYAAAMAASGEHLGEHGYE